MKNIILLITLCALFVPQLPAQETQTSDTKIDSILQKQDRLLDKQDKIYEEVKYNDPLASRNVGIELNPALLLVSIANESLILSGGFSLFNVSPQAELAFPVWYHDKLNDEPYKVFTSDAIYRYYFGKYRRGFYISGGVRYAYLEGKKSGGYSDAQDQYHEYDKTNSVLKFGVHFGIGVRLFARNGLYWGASLITGTYFSDDTDEMDNLFIDAGKFLFDVEFLKFGFAF
jgi:hypothetical protein